ncbi:hypothetical protein [Microbacterium sp.]|jgi:hypothetical protein|uniref:hypothetical protein n=1 Tax=Microbacterium sp. TaxID=51671 RepID=UPI000C082E44|nr:hypothetical protein [Microbacterium sp.]PYD02308.1 hypothetical protein B4U78_001115 [Microbacterium esteraromaticum]
MGWNEWATAGGTVWFSIALVISALAGMQGRTKLGWFVLGMIFGPLALLLLVFLIQPSAAREELPAGSAVRAQKSMSD